MHLLDSAGHSYSRHDGKLAGHLAPLAARAFMAPIGVPEPASRRGILAFSTPCACKPDKGTTHWPINHPGLSANEVAWALIHGIEDGWFAHDRPGFLHRTEQGREQPQLEEAAPRERPASLPTLSRPWAGLWDVVVASQKRPF